jgi:hypothetical protein
LQTSLLDHKAKRYNEHHWQKTSQNKPFCYIGIKHLNAADTETSLTFVLKGN